jgi:hypothetical protein
MRVKSVCLSCLVGLRNKRRVKLKFKDDDDGNGNGNEAIIEGI